MDRPTNAASRIMAIEDVNKLLVHTEELVVEYNRCVSELGELEDEKYRLIKEGRKDEITEEMRARIKKLEGICDKRSNDLEKAMLYLASAHQRLTESVPANFEFCLDKDTLEKDAERYLIESLLPQNRQDLFLLPPSREEIQACIEAGSAFLLTNEGKFTLKSLGLDKQLSSPNPESDLTIKPV